MKTLCLSLLATLTTLAACDDRAVDHDRIEARALDHAGLWELAIDGQIRHVDVIDADDGLALRVRDGEDTLVEVLDDAQHGTRFREAGASTWDAQLVCDETSAAVVEFVLDGGLDGASDDFRLKRDPAGCWKGFDACMSDGNFGCDGSWECCSALMGC